MNVSPFHVILHSLIVIKLMLQHVTLDWNYDYNYNTCNNDL